MAQVRRQLLLLYTIKEGFRFFHHKLKIYMRSSQSKGWKYIHRFNFFSYNLWIWYTYRIVLRYIWKLLNVTTQDLLYKCITLEDLMHRSWSCDSTFLLVIGRSSLCLFWLLVDKLSVFIFSLFYIRID